MANAYGAVSIPARSVGCDFVPIQPTQAGLHLIFPRTEKSITPQEARQGNFLIPIHPRGISGTHFSVCGFGFCSTGQNQEQGQIAKPNAKPKENRLKSLCHLMLLPSSCSDHLPAFFKS